LQLAAASAISDSSLKLVARFESSADSVRKLNEPDASWGLPAGMFDMVKRNLMQEQARDFMNQSLADYRKLAKTFEAQGLVTAAPYDGFHEVVRRHAETREERLALLAKGGADGADQGGRPDYQDAHVSRAGVCFDVAGQHAIPAAARWRVDDSTRAARRVPREAEAGRHL
jgi:hypothetical protein